MIGKLSQDACSLFVVILCPGGGEDTGDDPDVGIGVGGPLGKEVKDLRSVAFFGEGVEAVYEGVSEVVVFDGV